MSLCEDYVILQQPMEVWVQKRGLGEKSSKATDRENFTKRLLGSFTRGWICVYFPGGFTDGSRLKA